MRDRILCGARFMLALKGRNIYLFKYHSMHSGYVISFSCVVASGRASRVLWRQACAQHAFPIISCTRRARVDRVLRATSRTSFFLMGFM